MKAEVSLFKHMDALYVEDDLGVLENISTTLEKFFRKVYKADNEKQAFEIYNEKKPKVLFVDIELKDGNGLDLIEKIRKEDRYTSIVVITSYDDTKYLKKAITLFLDDYILKPISFETILKSLNTVIQNMQTENKLEITFSSGAKYNLVNKAIIYNTQESLTKGEKNLLDLFVANQNKLVSFEMIEYEIYHNKPFNIGTIRNQVIKIRKVIGKDHLKNIMEDGYILGI